MVTVKLQEILARFGVCVIYILNKCMDMFRSQCDEIGDYVKGMLTCSHTHTL